MLGLRHPARPLLSRACKIQSLRSIVRVVVGYNSGRFGAFGTRSEDSIQIATCSRRKTCYGSAIITPAGLKREVGGVSVQNGETNDRGGDAIIIREDTNLSYSAGVLPMFIPPSISASIDDIG